MTQKFYKEPGVKDSLQIRRQRQGDYFHSHPEYKVERDNNKCIRCLVCVRECPYDCTYFDTDRNVIYNIDANCVNCKRCEVMCPTQCIEIRDWGNKFRANAYWDFKHWGSIYKQADTGAVVLTGLGNDEDYKSYFDRMVLDAS